jgi:trans-2,3-dihydro-3-hydroxyanthranilate isomerase
MTDLMIDQACTPQILELPYRLCDVFTKIALQGNQLAIFDDAGELTTAEMQKLANETNLSETTFVIRREEEIERREGIRVRIFTTTEELAFAGHPTLGTAAAIRSFFSGYQDAKEIVLDLNVGKVPVRFPAESSGGSVRGVMTQPKPVFGALHDPIQVAAALGLAPEDLLSTLTPQTVSTGLAFCVVILRSVAVLERLRIPQQEATAYLEGTQARFFYCIAPIENEPKSWRARMQFYHGEDPATGSAAGCAIAYLVQHRVAESGELVHIQQGIEIGRRSDLYVAAKEDSAGVDEVEVGGSTIFVARGHVFLERFTQFQQAC